MSDASKAPPGAFIWRNGPDVNDPRSKFLLEVANGTSNYTLVRGFGAECEKACEAFRNLACGPNQRKRLTHVLDGVRTVVVSPRSK